MIDQEVQKKKRVLVIVVVVHVDQSRLCDTRLSKRMHVSGEALDSNLIYSS